MDIKRANRVTFWMNVSLLWDRVKAAKNRKSAEDKVRMFCEENASFIAGGVEGWDEELKNIRKYIASTFKIVFREGKYVEIKSV